MKKILSTIGVVSGCLIFSAVHSQVKAQARTITGQVNDGEKPIRGATVTQQGTTQMTTTSSTGAFSLQITGENPVLIFRHPEYTEQKMTTDGKTTFSISLTEKVKSIEEVVLNAGYYNVKAKESTGSISKVTAKDIENQPVNNVLSAVQGRMAGVSITQNTGALGGGFDVQIRGKNSLRRIGNDPLYVIDGIPIVSDTPSKYSGETLPYSSINPLNSLSPNDIESIEVLKDADATAIYGSRGANGVILVTTKKGTSDGLVFSLLSNYGISKVVNTMDMMKTEQYLEMRKQAYDNNNITPPANAYDINGAWNNSRYTDWQKILVGKWSESSTVQLSIRGGSQNHSFSLSAGHSDQTTVFIGDFRYKTNTFSSNYNYKSRNKKFNITTTNLFSSLSNNVFASNFVTISRNLSPNAPALYDETGNVNWDNNTFVNPVALTRGTYSSTSLQFNENINLSYQLWKDFQIKLNSGLNTQNFEEYSLRPNTINNPAYPAGASPQYSSSTKNSVNRFSYLLEPQLFWEKKYGNHAVSVLVGSTFQKTKNLQFAITGSGFPSNALLHNIGAATQKTIKSETDSEYKYASVYSRINYQFMHKYILNITGRRDGSSRFGANRKFANFGAVGGAWLFSEEKFLNSAEWLSFGKLRGSFGVAGSDALGDYQYMDTYTLSDFQYNGNAGLSPSRLYNPDFSWEKTRKLEAALDLGFLKDRLRVKVAWYKNRSTNQLVGIPLPATTGFSSVQANLDANVENRGWEFELSITPFKESAFKWETAFNISFPQNELISFPGLENSTYANTYVVGYNTSVVKLFQYEGINSQTGNYTFTDFNNDGKISSPDDTKAFRNIGVQYFGGLQNDFKYKNLRLSFLLQFVKQTNWNYFASMLAPGSMNNQPVEFANVWSTNNPNGIIMPYSPGNIANTNTLTSNFKNSTAAVGDASYIRLKNIQIEYKLPNTILKDVLVYVQGQNILTFTNYFGPDPEFISLGYLPPLKTYALGAKFNF